MLEEIKNDTLNQTEVIDTGDLPFLQNIALMQTFKCTIACKHCLMDAGPHRTEEMSYENSIQWLSQAREYRDGHVLGLALTGGEPFCNLDMLGCVSEQATNLGFATSAVTNAYWATSKEKALSVLESLPGIRLLCISADQFHQKHIPIDYVRNVAYAADQRGVIYSFNVCAPNFQDKQFLEILGEVLEICHGDRGRIRTSVTFPVGRAEKCSKNFNYEMIDTPPVGACQMASSPVVFPDGKVLGCIGPVVKLDTDHPLVLGNLNDNSLADILDRAEVNAALHAIRIWGPHKLFSLLKENSPNTNLPEKFISNCTCDVCYHLFKDESVLEALGEIINEDEEFLQLVAYGRAYYLNEDKMLRELTVVET